LESILTGDEIEDNEKRGTNLAIGGDCTQTVLISGGSCMLYKEGSAEAKTLDFIVQQWL